jgi:hypothetical protein
VPTDCAPHCSKLLHLQRHGVRLAVPLHAAEFGALTFDANVKPRAAIQQVANLDVAAVRAGSNRNRPYVGTE